MRCDPFKICVLLCALVFIVACGSGGGSSADLSGELTTFSETEYVGGVVTSLVSGRIIVAELEPVGGTPAWGDTGTTGEDEFTVNIAEDITLDLCNLLVSDSWITRLTDSEGNVLMSWDEGVVYNECADDVMVPVPVPAGDYTIKLWQDPSGTTSTFIMISLDDSENGTKILTSAEVKEYSFTEPSYKAGTVVSYKGTMYISSWYASMGHCPLRADCPLVFEDGLWKVYDPSVKHEFAYYNYPDLVSKYPALPTCTADDYSFASVQSAVNGSAEIASAAPEGGYSEDDKDALYREYMLPCQPDLASYEPDNVKTVKSILTRDIWNAYAGNLGKGDLETASSIYTDGDGNTVQWPAEDGFKSNSYDNFLNAVARYPYFCGEKGYFSSVSEACKRELASLMAHAVVETGNRIATDLFYWLREYGYVNKMNNRFDSGCTSPFDCAKNGFALYYGRGPKQLTSYYNYAGFSAAYFNGNYNFLLYWPDLIAYDGKMFFESAIFYTMTNQPPKPSIHDVLLGRYTPTECVSASDCKGLQYDATSGVKHNFGVTIEVVNGAVECREDTSSGPYAAAPGVRSDSFKIFLGEFGATLTDDEVNQLSGCSFITFTKTDGNTLFVQTKAKSGLHTWIELATGKTCVAQSTGGNAMVSVTAKGIVTACKQ